MKVLELTMYATKRPYIEFTSCIPLLKMARDIAMDCYGLYDYIHTDAQKRHDLADQNHNSSN